MLAVSVGDGAGASTVLAIARPAGLALAPMGTRAVVETVGARRMAATVVHHAKIVRKAASAIALVTRLALAFVLARAQVHTECVLVAAALQRHSFDIVVIDAIVDLFTLEAILENVQMVDSTGAFVGFHRLGRGIEDRGLDKLAGGMTDTLGHALVTASKIVVARVRNSTTRGNLATGIARF